MSQIYLYLMLGCPKTKKRLFNLNWTISNTLIYLVSINLEWGMLNALGNLYYSVK